MQISDIKVIISRPIKDGLMWGDFMEIKGKN